MNAFSIEILRSCNRVYVTVEMYDCETLVNAFAIEILCYFVDFFSVGK